MRQQHKISVTQEDIDTGVKKSCWKCPVALAIRREFPLAKDVEVGGTSYSFQLGNREYSGTLPESASDFIRKYDYDSKMLPGPFTFILEV